MTLIDLAQLRVSWVAHEAAVDATAGIDPWCSGPDWALPVAAGFAADDTEHIVVSAADGFATLARNETANGTRIIAGLEPVWGFGFPVVGPHPERLIVAVADHLDQRDDWDLLVLPGAPLPPHSLFEQLAPALLYLGEVQLAEGITRQVADLSNGYQAWMDQRSSSFRRNLRRAVRQATDAGITIVNAAAEPRLVNRLLDIEHRSWKGLEGSGITHPAMITTYTRMIDRLAKRERLHCHVAQLDGQDVGYILGGVRGRRYRGLQISYADDAPDLSIGNVLQHHQITLLTGNGSLKEGIADTYDMGMDFDYKRRWADRPEPSTTLLVRRR